MKLFLLCIGYIFIYICSSIQAHLQLSICLILCYKMNYLVHLSKIKYYCSDLHCYFILIFYLRSHCCIFFQCFQSFVQIFYFFIMIKLDCFSFSSRFSLIIFCTNLVISKVMLIRATNLDANLFLNALVYSKK